LEKEINKTIWKERFISGGVGMVIGIGTMLVIYFLKGQ
jgi:hypothetical protein